MSKTAIENREVSWNVQGIPVCGTITAPVDKEAHSAIIFIAGSGPTDRDWCTPLLPGTNGSAKLLAEALASEGFATLRFDKLGSGPHVVENLSKFTGKICMQYYIEEITGAVETVLAETNVKKDNLFVLANSEGTIHAVNYQLQAKNNRFKGLVLTGAPARSMGDLARVQLSKQFEPLPGGELVMKHYDEAVAQFTTGKPVTPDPSLPEVLKNILLTLETPSNLPFSRELWAYSLADHIAKVTEPLLVVIGKKDIQVDWKANGEALEEAARQNSEATFLYPETANHVLKHEEAPVEKLDPQSVSLNYNAPGIELDEEAVNAIINWLKKF
ncbi:alpha/beta hydrolase family protein [Methanocella sp. MCL-LM]|uniref:alpha/beta hydrolase family protein n=1 Tax=Methanocella sp. MCL-LM TaxID=3412035 RepID=UPI003C72E9C8